MGGYECQREEKVRQNSLVSNHSAGRPPSFCGYPYGEFDVWCLKPWQEAGELHRHSRRLRIADMAPLPISFNISQLQGITWCFCRVTSNIHRALSTYALNVRGHPP